MEQRGDVQHVSFHLAPVASQAHGSLSARLTGLDDSEFTRFRFPPLSRAAFQQPTHECARIGLVDRRHQILLMPRNQCWDRRRSDRISHALTLHTDEAYVNTVASDVIDAD